MSTDTPTPPTQTPSKAEATAFLQSLLNKNLRVTTTDNRMFWGAFNK
ncbi:8bf650c0-d209-417f-a7e6-3c8537a5fea8 [Thermothielavioides terrestris]|uniref:8bf650c0-d209-417f-a7e6-3c8537a5fea8 n=1 Tax=Thermothielavioides terrestris TaxID=2587410 RepID=A0A3S4AMX4_9PEZI|nr:8bf650c0-d209-417f-a7e6-3c8537a5fea8 [Thermothielavioides terrestris]